MVKRKVILPPELPPEVDEDELEISDEDIDFVKENREFAGFLTKLDTKSIDRYRLHHFRCRIRVLKFYSQLGFLLNLFRI